VNVLYFVVFVVQKKTKPEKNSLLKFIIMKNMTSFDLLMNIDMTM